MQSDNLHKGTRHAKAPAGFTRIPKSKHNGYRKRQGDHWIYWYPDQHRGESHLDWEPDLAAGIGTGGLSAGQFVSELGVQGSLYAWTPDVKKAPEGKTWVTPVDPDSGHIHGDPKLVEVGQLQPMRSFDPESRRKRRRKKAKTAGTFQTSKTRPRRPPPARTRPGTKGQQALAKRRRELQAKIKQAEAALKKTKDPDKIAALESAIVAATEALKTLGISTKASVNATTVKWEDSTARPGTFLHRLENGYYPVIEFAKGDNHLGLGRRTHGVFVPPQDVPGVFSEFEGNMVNVANAVANKYRIKNGPGREDVVSGAKLGLMLALRSYTGGTSFIRFAQKYMNAYALDAARDVKSAGSAKIPMRQMQMIHGLIAATARASAKNEVPEPTVEQIAREWNLKKEQTFAGRKPVALGAYAKGDKTYNQATEQVPLNDWQILSPTGEPTGKKYPGKRTLIEEMQPLLSGERVEDSQWINEHQDTLVPLRSDATMPLGAQYHLRQQIDEVTDKLSPRNKATIELLFGLNEDTEADSRSGYMITKEELVQRLGLAKKTAGKSTIYNKANAAIKDALEAFKKEAVAQGKGRMARAASTKWNRIEDNPPPKKTGPTFRELRDRFGGADRARMYLTAVRAGEGSKVAKILEDWKADKLTAAQRDKFLREHTRRRDVERMRQFHNQSSTTMVDPSTVKPPQYETSQDADYLYAGEVARGAMRALANGVKRPPKPGKPADAMPWDDARFEEIKQRLERLKELRRQ